MNFQRKALLVVLLMFLMSGCTGAENPTSTLTIKPSNSPDALATTQLTIQMTHTPRSATESPVPLTNTNVPPKPTDTATSPPTEVSQPTGTSTPLPPLTGIGGGVIAFVSNRDGNFEIYVMNADGSDQRRLTYNTVGDWAPAWSPDGKQLAFTSERDGNFEIYVIDFSDGIGVHVSEQDPPVQKRLTYRETNDWDPDWSPDGSQIVFHSEHGEKGFDIWMINADGSDPQQLSNNADEEIHIAWAPDGSRFAVESNGDGNYQIYVMAADRYSPSSPELQRLTIQEGGNRFPDWSPDGSQIAFSSMRDGNSEIYVMDADGSNNRRLTVNKDEDWDPTWSPDGTQLAFRSRRDGNWEIYTMDADGSNQRRLTNTSADEHYPAWWWSLESTSGNQSHTLGDAWTRSKDGMQMVWVPGGEFQMGSNDDGVDYAMQLCSELSDNCQRWWYEDQLPVHMVGLDGFWIDKYEVTNAQYLDCVDAGECLAPTTCDWGEPTFGVAGKADHPVACVDWQGARDYCKWAGGRLLTEAEWEYAARGPSANIFPWGNVFDGTLANSCDTNCTLDWRYVGYNDGYSLAAPVGSYPGGASWCGAEDLAGNIWEWVMDWYAPDYYRVSPFENPIGPSSGEYRVARGGSWRDGSNGELHLAAMRYYPGVPSLRTSSVGFRCASSSDLP